MPSEIIHLDAPLLIQAVADGDSTKPATATMMVYSGGLFSPPGWPNTILDLRGADVSGTVPIVVDHGENLDDIAGQGRAEIRDNKIFLNAIIVRSSPAGKKVIALTQSSINLQASVGYAPGKREFVSPGQSVTVNGRTFTAENNGLTIIRSGKLRNVALVSTGSDPYTTVNIAATAAFSQKGKNKMSTENQSENDFIVTSEQEKMLHANFHSATIDPAVEQKRMQLIECWYPRFDPKISPDLCGKANMLKARAINGEIGLEQYRMEAVDLIRAERPQAPAIHGSSRDGGTTSEIVQAAFLIRAGYEKAGEKYLPAAAMQQGRDMRASSILDIFRFSLHADGKEIPHSVDGIIRAGFSTNTLPVALGNSMEKVAMASYNEAPQTWRSFAGIKSATNFRQQNAIRLNNMQKPEEVGEAGEIKHTNLTESIYNYQVFTYAKMVSLTRQAIVNDDLGIFNDIPVAFGKSDARKINDIVYTMLLANAGSHFSEANGNYFDGSDSALGTVALGEALRLLRMQVDADGSPLDLVPKVLLVGPTLEQTGRQLLNSIQLSRDTSGDQLPTGNPFSGLNLTLEVEPRLEAAAFTNHSATAWYLLCGPNDSPIIVAFLNGVQTPTVEQDQTDFSTLGVQYRIYHDYGSALGDPAAAVMSKGTT